jgi:hypothetical protein
MGEVNLSEELLKYISKNYNIKKEDIKETKLIDYKPYGYTTPRTLLEITLNNNRVFVYNYNKLLRNTNV